MTKEWRWTINLPPMATPRPQFRRTEKGQTITYYHQAYVEYLDAIQEQLKKDEALNDTFFEILNTPLGVKAEILFFVQAPKSQKRLNKLTRTTAPDIDNLLKAVLDGIFKGLDVKDSRIALVSMGKFQEMDNPRTEVLFRGISDE